MWTGPSSTGSTRQTSGRRQSRRGNACPDASTACLAVGGQCTQLCERGFEDDDCDPTTECVPCTRGLYSSGGYRVDDSPATYCSPCAPGNYAPQDSELSDCEGCPAGQADDDSNTWTPCQECALGTYTAGDDNALALTNATRCLLCAAGTIDNDTDPSTACDPCAAGTENPVAGSSDAEACVDCAPGRWSPEVGAAACMECPAGLFRGDGDGGCQACDEGEGERCDGQGTEAPSAGPGFFVGMMNANGSQAIVKCRPPRACFGTCGADVRASLIAALDATNDTDLEYSDCPGGRGQELCSPGYEGPRCSQCSPITIGGTCSDDDPNGYYRLDGRCEVRRGLCRAQHCQLTTLILVCLPAVPMQRVRPVVDGRSCDRALRSHGSSGGQVRSCSVRLPVLRLDENARQDPRHAAAGRQLLHADGSLGDRVDVRPDAGLSLGPPVPVAEAAARVDAIP